MVAMMKALTTPSYLQTCRRAPPDSHPILELDPHYKHRSSIYETRKKTSTQIKTAERQRRMNWPYRARQAAGAAL